MKRDVEEVLLERWCRQADLDALGELFDLVAPRLLKLAVHLVGDAGEAEDLVQQTFLVLIERRKAVRLSDPVMPWLIGVLNHKASDARRRAARSVDVSDLLQREAQRPDVALEERELSGEVAKAADALEEPYRQVVLLRLRHGLSTADIAHLLERSPATVRVQLHRAHEQLKRSLPTSLVSALAFGLGHARGLGELRVSLMQEAATVAVAPSMSATLGAWIVSQKLIVASACALILVVTSAWQLNRPETAAEEPADLVVDQEPVQELAFVAKSGLRPSVADPTDERVALEARSAPNASKNRLRGRVLDASTGKPIVGASLELHAPRKSTRQQALIDHPELYTQGADGRLEARTGADWPRIEGSSDASRFDREQLTVYDLPSSDSPAIATALSMEDGRFEFVTEEGSGLIVVTHAGFLTRYRPAPDSKKDWEVELHRAANFSGRLIFDGGHEPVTPLTLVVSSRTQPPNFVANHKAAAQANRNAGPPRSAHNLQWFRELLEGVGSWKTPTDKQGRFSCTVAEGQLTVDVLEPGWEVKTPGIFRTGQEATVVVTRVPSLRFIDARTGAPIERVHLLAKERSNSYVRVAGAYNAPDGYLSLPLHPIELKELSKDSIELHAWSEGYAATHFTLTEIDRTQVREIRLERGSIATLRGRITRDGRVQDSVSVSLLGLSPLQWNESLDSAVDGRRVDEHGEFELSAPRGKYVLRVRDAEDDVFEVVELPREARLDLDLGRLGSIEVQLRDSEGEARGNHMVVLHGKRGRNMDRKTDEQGVARFEGLSPSPYTIMVPHLSTEYSFSADEVHELELTRGEHKLVHVEVPANREARFPRLLTAEGAPVGIWRVSYSGYDNWKEVEADGRIPLELGTNAYEYEIEAPDGRRWCVPIPKKAEDGVVLQVDAGGESYRGVLLDGNGVPLSGVRITAEPWRVHDPKSVRVSSITGTDGGFELHGLKDHAYRFVFHQNPERSRTYERDSDYQGVMFLPHELPGRDTFVEVRLVTEVSKSLLRGVVRRKADGSPVTDNMMFVQSESPDAHGTLSLGLDSGFIRTDMEGRFELMVPRTAQRTYRVFASERGEPIQLEVTLPDEGSEPIPEIELLVP